jgi:hypothetical protein
MRSRLSTIARISGRDGLSRQLTHNGSAASSVSQVSSCKPAAAEASSIDARGSVATPKPLATSARIAEIEEIACTRACGVDGEANCSINAECGKDET